MLGQRTNARPYATCVKDNSKKKRRHDKLLVVVDRLDWICESALVVPVVLLKDPPLGSRPPHNLKNTVYVGNKKKERKRILLAGTLVSIEYHPPAAAVSVRLSSPNGLYMKGVWWGNWSSFLLRIHVLYVHQTSFRCRHKKIHHHQKTHAHTSICDVHKVIIIAY